MVLPENLPRPYWNIRYGGRCALPLSNLLHTQADYAAAIKKLFPLGVYWDAQFDDPQSDLSQWVEAQAEELYRFKSRFPSLIQEATPKTADTTIDDWERVLLGSVYPHLPLEMRRSLLLSKRRGFISKPVLQEIAALYGVNITVSYLFTPACFAYASFGSARLGDYKVFSALSVSVLGGEKLTITNGDRAKFIMENLKSDKFSVREIEAKERKTEPAPPFMTSTLQQSASNRLGFSPKKTMMIAQNLYEGVQTHQGFMGAITYMRTDSLNLAKEAVAAAREMIEKEYGERYLPAKAKIYATKSKGAQEAHEAIRPTNLSFTPAIAAQYLEKDALRLYTLIYNRFLACQMSASISQTQNVFVAGAKGEFKISGRKVLFDGFYRIYGDMDKDKILPDLKIGDEMSLQSIKSSQHFTEPPSRYSEAGLVKKLESLGIGRPSTYAPTISLLTSRDYVKVEKKQLVPNEIAFTMMGVLEEHFSDIVDSEFTSNMEEKLDHVAEDKADWQKLLSDFYHPFMDKISAGKTGIKSQKVATPIGEKCPECGGELLLRKGRYGEFIACGNFPKCKYSRNIAKADQGAQEGEAAAKPKKELKKIDVPCPKCGGDIVERISRRGKFYGCANYPKCDFVSNYEPVAEKCDECGGDMIKKELKKGTFHECVKCKKKVQIEDL